MLYQLSHFRSPTHRTSCGGAESQNRTGDTVIFSHVLYQLSYLAGLAKRTGSIEGAMSPGKGRTAESPLAQKPPRMHLGHAQAP